MAAANTTPLASGLRNGDDGLEQHKGPVGWTARAFDSTHRSSAGESGRRVISRHLTRRRFHAYRLGLSRMVELRRARNDLNRLGRFGGGAIDAPATAQRGPGPWSGHS